MPIDKRRLSSDPFSQDLTLINPMRYFIIIVGSVFLEDLPAKLLISQYWPMAPIGLLSLTCAGWLFRRRMY